MNFNSHGDWTRRSSLTLAMEGAIKGVGPSLGDCQHQICLFRARGFIQPRLPQTPHISPFPPSPLKSPKFPTAHMHTKRHTNTPTPTKIPPDTHRHSHRCTCRHSQAEKHKGTQTSRHVTSQGPPPVTQISLSSAPSQHQSDPLKVTWFKK